MTKLATIFFAVKVWISERCNQTDGTYILCRKLIQEVFFMKKPLTATIHIGGKQVDTLTEEQLERMSQRLTEAMSIYYTSHIDEYKKIKN